MNTEGSRLTLLRRSALLCALIVIAIVGISAFIRLSGAGLGCSPWPDCYGQTLREVQQGVVRSLDMQADPSVTLARSAHRFLAMITLPLVLVLVLGGFTMYPTRWRGRWASLLALALVVFLAVLGRWTTGTRLPAVMLGNLLAGFLLFALCWRMAAGGPHRPAGNMLSRHARVWRCVAVAVLLFQVVLGGLVSSTFAGFSCPDLAGCAVSRPVQWETLNPLREPHFDPGILPLNADGALVHLLHRWGAAAAVLAVIAAAIALLRCGRRPAALALLVLLGTQVALGLLLVHNGLPLAIAVAHNIVAALLLASLVGID